MKKYFTKTKTMQCFSVWRTVCLIAFLSFKGIQSASAQYTAIPDAAFEQALYDQGIDEVLGDQQVLTSAIAELGQLDVPGLNISDLTGIKHFTNLQYLYCWGNNLTNLDVSGMSNLISLNCSYNPITNLNINGCSSLLGFECAYGLLTSLNISGLTNLRDIYCDHNQLNSVNLSGLPSLTTFGCDANQLSSLDVSNLTNLQLFGCAENQLTSLNLTGLNSLTGVYCYQNQLSSIIFGGVAALTRLECNNNQLSSLNLTAFTALTNLNCSNNLISCITVTNPVAAAANVNWIKDTSATYSTNCGLVIPTTTLRANQCGITLAALNTNIVANIVPNYQMYRFEVSNGATVNTFDTNRYNFNLTNIPGITYATTYSIRVAVQIGGVWGGYGSPCTVTTPTLTSNVVPTTVLQPAVCGATLASLDTRIGATPVYGAAGYRFEITTGGVTTIYDSSVYNFRLADAGVAAYGTTYAISVAALISGIYGNYGAPCTVTTPTLTSNVVPTTALLPAVCGTTLAALNTRIGTIPVFGATGYRFEITTGGVTTIYDSSVYNFRLVDAGVAAYGTTYTIRVAALISGIYGNFGASCTVTTPTLTSNVVPTTALLPSVCGTTLAALNTRIGTTPVFGASGYRFEITTGGVTTIYDSSVYNFRLSDAGVAAYGTTYIIRVAALISGVYGNYGASCSVTTPIQVLRLKAKTFEVSAYPNPFETAFNLNLETPSKSVVTVNVFDMLGRQVETKTIQAEELATTTLGSNYASGVYNIIVSQDENVKTLRMVKN